MDDCPCHRGDELKVQKNNLDRKTQFCFYLLCIVPCQNVQVGQTKYAVCFQGFVPVFAYMFVPQFLFV